MDLDRRGVGEKLGEIEGGETILQLYYMRKNLCLIKGIKGIHAYCGTMPTSMNTLTWRVKICQIPTLDKEPQATASCLEKEKQPHSWMRPLVGYVMERGHL